MKMAAVKGLMVSVQVALLLSIVCCVMGGALPEQQESNSGQQNAKKIVEDDSVAVSRHPVALSSTSADHDQQQQVMANNVNANFGRAKRYVGWGRKPSLRYSKASSMFDHDNLFNKLYNNFDKRLGPESPISSFRELRMKQKVPNAQILLPHLYSRNSRGGSDSEGASPTLSGSELAMALDQDPPSRLSEDDFEALLFLLENFANSRNEQK